jgi:hypothetical protein
MYAIDEVELMASIMEFLKGNLMEAILVSLWILLEYWLGKTDMVKPGSSLEAIMMGIKKLLEMFGFKKKDA